VPGGKRDQPSICPSDARATDGCFKLASDGRNGQPAQDAFDVMTTTSDFHDAERHNQALEAMAIQALADDRPFDALRYADRRCRVQPSARANQYILRADSRHRCGFVGAAILDIRTALGLAPDDLAANRRLLAWSKGHEQIEAANRLIPREHDVSVLRKSVEVLASAGQSRFFALSIVDRTITGWVAWKGATSVTLRDQERGLIAKIHANPAHPLAAVNVHAANISIELDRASSIETVNLWVGKSQVLTLATSSQPPSVTARGTGKAAKPGKAGTPATTNVARRAATIIIPIHSDFQATKTCLDGVIEELASDERISVILVNDATPDQAIAALVDEAARISGISALVNSRNLGFVDSVNRALLAVQTDDVILLNSDTAVPFGFVRKLADAAYSAADIGTVTPFSNNGEFTSFPIPFEANPIPPLEQIRLLDDACARANPGLVIDIPNGIGFCLYITRACLDAVGLLSGEYHRGYLEDVDFCLRARDRGFRNVCAPSIFVGHQGSASFGSEKRSLVVLNLERLEARYPTYRAECAAFLKVDPLVPARAAIERLLPPPQSGGFLLMTGAGEIEAVARKRAADLVAQGSAVLIAVCHDGFSGPRVTLVNAAGSVPQSLSYDLRLDTDIETLHSYLKSARLSRMEVLDPARTSRALVDFLLSSGISIELFIADAGLISPQPRDIWKNDRPASLGRPGLPRKPTANTIGPDGSIDHGHWLQYWRNVAATASAINIPSEHARGLAETLLGQLGVGSVADERLASKISVLETAARTPHTRSAAKHGTPEVFGILQIGQSVADYEMITAICRDFRQHLPDRSIVIIGQTLDDFALLKLDNVFITGTVQAHELALVVEWYGLTALLLARRSPLFGHPLVDAFFDVQGTLSFTFDWSMGDRDPSSPDFSLFPTKSNAKIAGQLRKRLKPAEGLLDA
jgi:GT2 family glycosyltransferase